MRLAPELVCLSIALTLGCGAATPRPVSPSPEPRAEASVGVLEIGFAPRLVRQRLVPTLSGGVDTHAEGRARRVELDGEGITVSDPRTGAVWMRERIERVAWAVLEPSGAAVCMTVMDGGVTHLAAYDLRSRRFRWQVELAAGEERSSPWGLATASACAAVVREGTVDHLALYRLEDGAPIATEAPSLVVSTGTELFFDARSAALVVSRPSGSSRMLELRDPTSLEPMAVLYASCIDADDRGRVRFELDEGVETPERLAYLERTLPDFIGTCSTPTPAPTLHVLGDPWALLDGERVAFHGEHGLYVFDPAAGEPPRRIEGAPPLIRYLDVNGSSRPVELVSPPDGSWVGVIREDGALVRFAVGDGAPLPEVPLPGPATTPREAEWQVFAGPGDRLLVVRHVGRQRVAYVGDVSGHFTRTRARLYPSIYQLAQYEGSRESWLFTDTHYGISRIDAATGRVVASYLPPPMWSRISRAVPSPDGREIFVGMQAAGDEPAELLFLDGETLAIARRLPAADTVWTDDLEWRDDGIVAQTGGSFFGVGWWMRLDPVTGAESFVARGPLRARRGHLHRDGLHLDRPDDGGALWSRRREDGERWLAVVADGAARLEADGTGWCTGEGCRRALHCVVGIDDAREATDPACAALLTSR